jgi:hypothetical protein
MTHNIFRSAIGSSMLGVDNFLLCAIRCVEVTTRGTRLSATSKASKLLSPWFIRCRVAHVLLSYAYRITTLPNLRPLLLLLPTACNDTRHQHKRSFGSHHDRKLLPFSFTSHGLEIDWHYTLLLCLFIFYFFSTLFHTFRDCWIAGFFALS